MKEKDNIEKEVREIMVVLTPLIEECVREYLSSGRLEIIQQNTEHNMEKRIRKVVEEFSIPANLKGYQFLIDAIEIVVNNPNSSTCIDIYSKIANKYNTTLSKIERAIRTAIEISWTKVDEEIIKKWFYNTKLKRPTNSRFIFTIANKLRNDY